MRLYFAPEQISTAPLIILLEAKFDFKLVRVNLTTMEASDGKNFLDINPNGYVPTLVLDNGKVLTETPAMLQYLADLKPELGLIPPANDWMRVELWEAFDFFSTEIHGLCIPLLMPEIADEVKVHLNIKLRKRLDYVERKIKGHTYMLGEQFMVIDAFAFSILDWMPRFSIDLMKWPNISALMQLLRKHPSVVRAREVERDFVTF